MKIEEKAFRLNQKLESFLTAEERIRYVISLAETNNESIVQTTSFGIQSCLMLDLLHKSSSTTSVPVVWIDTGYLPEETYHFADQLQSRYGLDLRVYQGSLSPARMEALHGKLWEDPSDEAHTLYNSIRKVEPMNRALRDLKASIVLTGLRASQTSHRQSLQFVNIDGQRLKVCPILDWSDEDVTQYFATRMLVYHPLYSQGYRSVGDAHSSEAYDPSIHKNERETRFHGRSQECGLHIGISSTTTRSPSVGSLTESEHSDSTADDGSAADTGGFVVYGRPKCRFCRASKELIKEISKELDPGVPLHEIEVGKTITKEALEKKLGATIKTVPQIVYKGKHIGGYDDLVQWGTTQYNSTFVKLASAINVE